jgi:hypothetical protein
MKHYVQLSEIRGNVDMKYYCQLAAIIVHWCNNHEKMFKDDFYTMVMKDSEENKGIRQPKLDRPGNPTPTFMFATKEEVDNFINYLKTDFARFCLSIYKNSQHLSLGEMSLIPYLDFTQEWDDEKLFKYFNVNKQTQNYIKEFLPDYHGVRDE